MRALQRELTTRCHTCNNLLLSPSIGAGGGRHSVFRKQYRLSVTRQESNRRRSRRGTRLLRTYAESGGAGGGGDGGRASTTFDDGQDSQPWSQYSLFGITIVLALSSFKQPSEAVHDYSSNLPAKNSASKEQTAVSLEPSQASNVEDTLLGAEQLSVRKALAGRTVLLTGITGFVGSLVLEQLLRTCPDVHKVYVIARKKHSVSGPERVQRMLHSHPLFHLVRAQICQGTPCQESEVRALQEPFSDRHSEQSNGFPSVEVLAGDMTLPGYGLAACEIKRLKEETEIIIHAAASISFDDHIHDAITHNYTATKNLAEMAAEMPNLKAFVHVSTAYVNGNQPKGATVSEHMLPLSGEVTDHASLVTQLQVLPRAQAASQANKYMQQWRLPNTYCFSKHLAESLMASYHSTTFPVAIVRPSIIGGLAGSPLPGYVGNTAGSTGAALAIATGIAAWTCHQPSSVFDVVPGDLVSSTILAAAAAATTQGHSMHRCPFIVHACTSSQNSLTTGQFFQHIQAYFTAQPPPFRVIVGAYPKYQGHNIVHSEQMLAARSALAEAKFLVLCTALKAAGRERLANKLYAGWKAWQKYNSPALDFNLCFQTHNLQRLQQLLPNNEQQMFRMSWECKDWQRYMTTYMAGIRHGVLKQPTLANDARHDFVPWPVRLSPNGTASKLMDIKPSGA